MSWWVSAALWSCAVWPGLLGGCTEQITQFAKLKGWTRPAGDRPVILSGSTQRDTAAFQASTQALSEAEWRILEQIAPRAIWERVERLQNLLRMRRRSEATTRPTATQPAALPDRQPPRVPVVPQADGKVRIVYGLRHYGGATVTSTTDGGTARRKISVATVDLKPLVAVINEHLAGKGTVAALPGRNTLVITCDPAAKDSVVRLIASIDTPPRQVEVTARIFEVSHDFDFQHGARAVLEHITSDETESLRSRFSTKAFLDSLVETALGENAFQGSVLHLMRVFDKAGVKLDATFEALASTGLIRVVASPRMTVSAGRTAYMLAGQELPVQAAKIANDKLVTEKLEYKPVGVQLYITPQVVGPDRVKLHAITIVSAVSGFAPVPSLSGESENNALVNPIIDTREAETSVSIPNGTTLVIGGLRMVRTVTREKKIPGLGDAPLVEWLFKNHRSQKRATDLYFFVTPRLIQ